MSVKKIAGNENMDNKLNEIKTFPVPYTLKEIKEKIINVNSESKPSKGYIINKAFKFHSKGNILEASKFYPSRIY